MQSATFRFRDDLMNWLREQALLNHRSLNKQAEYLFTQLKKEDEKKRYELGLNKLCQNGTHFFVSSDPAMNEFCNCEMYVYGEVVR